MGSTAGLSLAAFELGIRLGIRLGSSFFGSPDCASNGSTFQALATGSGVGTVLVLGLKIEVRVIFLQALQQMGLLIRAL